MVLNLFQFFFFKKEAHEKHLSVASRRLLLRAHIPSLISLYIVFVVSAELVTSSYVPLIIKLDESNQVESQSFFFANSISQQRLSLCSGGRGKISLPPIQLSLHRWQRASVVSAPPPQRSSIRTKLRFSHLFTKIISKARRYFSQKEKKPDDKLWKTTSIL